MFDGVIYVPLVTGHSENSTSIRLLLNEGRRGRSFNVIGTHRPKIEGYSQQSLVREGLMSNKNGRAKYIARIVFPEPLEAFHHIVLMFIVEVLKLITRS